ncbi:MAG: hypothetical protein H6745_23505 [Deltaproteobacteria bacterium]|nr:hypothetical protein [Deltaproteobacteria bacterium]
MTTTTMMKVAGLAALVSALAACGAEAPAPTAPKGPEGRVTVSVAPLSLAGVTDAEWTLTVRAGTAVDAPVVWTRALRSTQYGSADGAISYVGPCDASVATNTVTLHLTGLWGAGGAPLAFADPGDLVREAACAPDADTTVPFDVTVARHAEQGFFDVAVNFDDVFCSAKVDCVGDDDQPIELLHVPGGGGERGPTVVVGFACTSGASTPTYLHMTTMTLECSDGTKVTHVPSAGPGNVGGDDGPLVFQRAVYRVEEQLSPYAKCAWNQAFGLDLDAMAQAGVSCQLRGHLTASEAPLEDGGLTPEGAYWPYIDIDVPVTTAGALSCGKEGLDDDGSRVVTRYTNGVTREQFGYTMACAAGTPVEVNGFACGGQVAGYDEAVVMAPSNGAVVVSIGSRVSAPLPLPEGVSATLEGCCMEPCCQ